MSKASPVRIFISYSRKDLVHLEALETHLANLKRQQRIAVWTDQRLRPSTEWEPDLLGQLRSAEIVLLLVTPDLMASDFIHDVELKETLERHKNGSVKVVPVLVRPTDFEGHVLARFQGLPRNFKPIGEWRSPDTAWLEVAKGVRELVEFLRPPNPAPETIMPTPTPARTHTAMKTAPSPAPETEKPPALTLLHISDLHFGQARGEGRVHFDQLKVVGELLKDARAMREKLGSPDAILVTGDIAFSARPEQYQKADEWLKELATAVGVTSDKIWLVPGNHDVDRSLATKPLGRKKVHQSLRANPNELEDYFLQEHIAEFAEDLWPKLEPYAGFARSFAAPALSAEHPFWRREITSPLGKLLLVGLNSCLLTLDGTDAKSNLALSQAQLHRVLEPLPDHALTLALMHHPPEWLSDGEELLKELQKGPHLLFSGHIHAAGGGVLHGLGQGSRLRFDAGASHTSPDEPGRHEYAWIRLSHDGLDWYPRVYSTKRNAFKADGERLEDQQIHQRIEPGQLPKPLREWLELPRIKIDSGGPPSPSLPHPFVPLAWSTWAKKEYDTLTPLIANQSPISFRLEKVYVELHSTWRTPKEAEAAQKRAQDGQKRSGKRAKAENEGTLEAIPPPRRSIPELIALPDAHHLAIKGGPGGGKSTALRRLMLNLLNTQMPEPVLPIYLELKEFGSWLAEHPNGGNEPDQLLAWAGSRLAKYGLPEAELSRRLGFGKVIWLLDGLDEIFQDTLRLRAAHILGGYLKHARQPTAGAMDRLVLTGRPHAFEDARVVCALGLEYRVAELDDLTDAERAEFLEKWFTEVYPHNAALALEQAQTLTAALPHHREVNELSRTPLMLSTMAAVYHMGKVLPERRADLYHHAVDVMLHRRFGGMQRPGDYQQRQVRRALSVSAREMMLQGQVRTLGRADFERVLSAVFYSTQHPSGMTEEQRQKLESLCEWLGSQSGLLALKGDPLRYTFSHLGLQEFLCAEWYASRPDPLVALGNKLDQESWREVVLLTGGILLMDGRGALGERFLQALYDSSADEAHRGYRTELLARVMAEAPKGALSEAHLPHLKERCVEVISSATLPSTFRERVSIGQSLGKVGDPRLGLTQPENWIWIPAGEFVMGDDKGDSDLKPAHKVTFAQGFHMSRFLVTNHDFKAFVEAGGYSRQEWWSDEGWHWQTLKGEAFEQWFQALKKKETWIREEYKDNTRPGSTPRWWENTQWNAPNQPVVGVSWYESEAFCRWMNTQRQHLPSTFRNGEKPGVIRLPTEAEWEYAARGKDGRKYPWSNEEPIPDRANYDQTGLEQTSPVGAFPQGATPEGLLDMAGNAWEWTEDDWHPNYTNAPPNGSAWTELRRVNDENALRVSRGGSWSTVPDWLWSSFRDGDGAWWRDADLGFRLVSVPSLA